MLAVAMLAGLVVSLTTPQRASAAVSNYHPATYNMQGGGTKWLTDIPQLARGFNVIALQEAGSMPPGRLTWTSRRLGAAQQWSGLPVQHYVWRPQGQSQDWNIYFLRTDAGGNRVNLAILTSFRASEVHLARPAFWRNGLPTSRPALGITVGGTLFFSVHALASGGNDGARLLANMNAGAGTRIWAAMGDWNRAPNRLAIRPGWHRYTAGAPTHQSGGELDYMVSNERIAGYGGIRSSGMGSDHYAVGFRRLAANASVQLLNAHDGNRALDVRSQNSTTVGSDIVSANTTPGPYGHFKFVPATNDTYTIRITRNDGLAEQCLDAIDTYLRRFSCDGTSSQRFDMTYWNDTGQLEIKPVNRTTCLGDDTDFGRGTELVTTMRCDKGEARFNFRFDRDPGPNAPLVVF